jgi:hypothetical protein
MKTNERTKYPKRIPIDVIKKSVSNASNVSLTDMELPNSWPLARQREKVNAREISMALSKDYSGESLASIGLHHGGRDHATVLHACKTINNLLDTKDIQITELYKKSNNLIDNWVKSNVFLALYKLSSKEKTLLVKHWIKCHVPLFVRERILKSMGKMCAVCGQLITINNKNGHKIKTLSNSLQRSYKK